MLFRSADKVVIKPYTTKHLAFVECSFKTVRGKIVSNWKRENGRIIFEIEIPSSTVAEFITDKVILSTEGAEINLEALKQGKYRIICKDNVLND